MVYSHEYRQSAKGLDCRSMILFCQDWIKDGNPVLNDRGLDNLGQFFRANLFKW